LSDDIVAGIADYVRTFDNGSTLLDKADFEFFLRDDIPDGEVIEQREIMTLLDQAFPVSVAPVEGTKRMFFCNRYVYIVQQVDDILRGRRTYLPYAGNDAHALAARLSKVTVVALIKRIQLNTRLYECYERELGDEIEDLYFSMVALKADSIIHPAAGEEEHLATPRTILPLYGLIDSMPLEVRIDAIELAYNSVGAGSRVIGRLQRHGERDMYTDANGGIYLVGYEDNWFTLVKHGVRDTSARELVCALQTIWYSMPEPELIAMAQAICGLQAESRRAEIGHRCERVIAPDGGWTLRWQVPRGCKIRFFNDIAAALLGGEAVSVNSHLVFVNIASRTSVRFLGIGRNGFTISMLKHAANPVAFFDALDERASDADTEHSDAANSDADSVISSPVSRGNSGVSAVSGYSSGDLACRLSHPVPQLTHTLERLLSLFE
jgi:hypothetical protein